MSEAGRSARSGTAGLGIEGLATYQFLAGNRAALPGMLLFVIVGGGLGEETIWRGYLFERLGRLLGPGGAARWVMLAVSSVLFALAHFPDQGLPGAEQAVITGMVFGTIYLVTRSIWMSAVIHAAFDVAAVVMIYAGWEDRVAHLFF